MRALIGTLIGVADLARSARANRAGSRHSVRGTAVSLRHTFDYESPSAHTPELRAKRSPGYSGNAQVFAAGSSCSAIRHSVVSIRPATLAAFCSAARTTFAGSITPMASNLPYSPVAAL